MIESVRSEISRLVLVYPVPVLNIHSASFLLYFVFWIFDNILFNKSLILATLESVMMIIYSRINQPIFILELLLSNSFERALLHDHSPWLESIDELVSKRYALSAVMLTPEDDDHLLS